MSNSLFLTFLLVKFFSSHNQRENSFVKKLFFFLLQIIFSHISTVWQGKKKKTKRVGLRTQKSINECINDWKCAHPSEAYLWL